MSCRLTLTSIVALALCIAPRAHAQSESGGRIEGVVYDSVHHRPLAGTHVVAVGTGARSAVRGDATSDSLGRYHIDSLPLGQYIIGFESALLDSLEVNVSPREATVTPGAITQVKLAMPSAAKLRASLCPGVLLSKDEGVVYGRVVSAESENPLPDVSVALQWRELQAWDSNDKKPAHIVAKDRLASVKTDDGGWYHACGVPVGTWLSLQLQRDGRIGPVLRTLIDDTLGIAIHHLSYSATSARDSSEFTDSTKLTPFVGTATLTGVVRALTGAAVPAAQVHLLGAKGTAVTDAEGRYTLVGLPAGTHQIEVRRIGYGITNAWVELRSGATAKGDVRMERVVNLDSVRVVAVSTRYKEFAAHQKMGLGGRFIGPDEIRRRHFNRTSDLVRSMTGLVVENGRSGRTRVYLAGGGNRCIMNVAINGFSGWSDDPDAFSVDDVPPRDVGAIEIHGGGGDVGGGPPELDHGCGSIVIWTKR
jgi:hypothetical protein